MHEALEKLRQFDPRLSSIINLRIFVGMTVEQTAEALGLTSRTINREWAVAKAWLHKELGVDGDACSAASIAAEDVADYSPEDEKSGGIAPR